MYVHIVLRILYSVCRMLLDMYILYMYVHAVWVYKMLLNMYMYMYVQHMYVHVVGRICTCTVHVVGRMLLNVYML